MGYIKTNLALGFLRKATPRDKNGDRVLLIERCPPVDFETTDAGPDEDDVESNELILEHAENIEDLVSRYIMGCDALVGGIGQALPRTLTAFASKVNTGVCDVRALRLRGGGRHPD